MSSSKMMSPRILPIVKATKISRSKLISAITTLVGSFSANGEILKKILNYQGDEAIQIQVVSNFSF